LYLLGESFYKRQQQQVTDTNKKLSDSDKKQTDLETQLQNFQNMTTNHDAQQKLQDLRDRLAATNQSDNSDSLHSKYLENDSGSSGDDFDEQNQEAEQLAQKERDSAKKKSAKYHDEKLEADAIQRGSQIKHAQKRMANLDKRRGELSAKNAQIKMGLADKPRQKQNDENDPTQAERRRKLAKKQSHNLKQHQKTIDDERQAQKEIIRKARDGR
jgi:chromosome segregation ATPase